MNQSIIILSLLAILALIVACDRQETSITTTVPAKPATSNSPQVKPKAPVVVPMHFQGRILYLGKRNCDHRKDIRQAIQSLYAEYEDHPLIVEYHRKIDDPVVLVNMVKDYLEKLQIKFVVRED